MHYKFKKNARVLKIKYFQKIKGDLLNKFIKNLDMKYFYVKLEIILFTIRYNYCSNK